MFRAAVPLEGTEQHRRRDDVAVHRDRPGKHIPSECLRPRLRRTPDAIQAASYDSVNLIAKALAQPGNLHDNLTAMMATQASRACCEPPNWHPGTLSNNTAIVRVGELGAPEVLARYQGNQRLPADSGLSPIPIVTVTPFASATPAASPTPQGVSLTITQQVQNVRSGPGDVYGVIGQLNRGDQAAIIGANAELHWVVVNFRGTQGCWRLIMLEVTGDLAACRRARARDPNAGCDRHADSRTDY